MTIYNFSPGPAALPDAVKAQICEDMGDWRNTGVSVMEVSHRGREFLLLADETDALMRRLLGIPDSHSVLLMPGGARLQYAAIPLNLAAEDDRAHYLISGHWGKEALAEAARFCRASATTQVAAGGCDRIPEGVENGVAADAAYVHYTSNETLEGVQWHRLPEVGAVPLCCDMTSDLLTRAVDVAAHDLIYASAQKNLGIAGITVVIVNHERIKTSQRLVPRMMDYQVFHESKSLYNTAPTFPWYVMNLVLQWADGQGGVAALEALNRQKSERLYRFIDGHDFYLNKVQPADRSMVNVPFWLADESLNEAFLAAGDAAGLKALAGHRVVGGMRASLYNALPLAAVDTLVEFMAEFARTRG